MYSLNNYFGLNVTTKPNVIKIKYIKTAKHIYTLK